MERCTNPDCKKKYWVTRIGDSVHGKEPENIVCPYCNTVGRIMSTRAFFMARKVEELHKGKIVIPSGHRLIPTLTKYEQGHNREIDTYWYDEADGEGKVVAKYILKDSASIYPPFETDITFEKVN